MTFLQERRTLFLMLCVLLLSGAALIAFGERIQIGGGYGFDGIKYGRLARQFPTEIQVVDRYYAQRILPSLLVYGGLRATFRPLDYRYVIAGFEVYNLVLLTLVAWLWTRLCREFKIGTRGQWLGFIGLFVNYTNLTFNYWYPCLTDRTMFAEGMLLLYFYMRRRQAGLLMTVVAAGFTAPSVAYSGLLLFVFPRQDTPSEPGKPWRGNAMGASLALATLVAIALTVFRAMPQEPAESPVLLPGTEVKVWAAFLVLSTTLAVAYIFLATRTFTIPPALLKWETIRTAKWPALARRIVLAAATAGAIAVLASQIATLPPTLEPGRFLLVLCGSAVRLPLVFVVAHFVAFGPILYFTVIYWQAIGTEIGRNGVGLVLYALGTIGLSLFSESRALVNLLPFVVLFTVVAAERDGLKSSVVWIAAATALVTSKVWLPVNGHFPQWYFANVGPWMPVNWYILQGALILGLGLLYYVLLRRTSRNTDSARRLS